MSPYGESKLAAEQVVHELAGRVEATVVRPPLVYGPRDKELLPPLFRMARAGLVAPYILREAEMIHAPHIKRSAAS